MSSFYLDPDTIRTSCSEYILRLESANENLSRTEEAILCQLMDDMNLTGEAIDACRDHLRDYLEVIRAIQAVSQFEIREGKSLMGLVGDEVLDGDRLTEAYDDLKCCARYARENAYLWYSRAREISSQSLQDEYDCFYRSWQDSAENYELMSERVAGKIEQYGMIENATRSLYASFAPLCRGLEQAIKDLAVLAGNMMSAGSLHQWKDEFYGQLLKTIRISPERYIANKDAGLTQEFFTYFLSQVRSEEEREFFETMYLGHYDNLPEIPEDKLSDAMIDMMAGICQRYIQVGDTEEVANLMNVLLSSALEGTGELTVSRPGRKILSRLYDSAEQMASAYRTFGGEEGRLLFDNAKALMALCAVLEATAFSREACESAGNAMDRPFSFYVDQEDMGNTVVLVQSRIEKLSFEEERPGQVLSFHLYYQTGEFDRFSGGGREQVWHEEPFEGLIIRVEEKDTLYGISGAHTQQNIQEYRQKQSKLDQDAKADLLLHIADLVIPWDLPDLTDIRDGMDAIGELRDAVSLDDNEAARRNAAIGGAVNIHGIAKEGAKSIPKEGMKTGLGNTLSITKDLVKNRKKYYEYEKAIESIDNQRIIELCGSAYTYSTFSELKPDTCIVRDALLFEGLYNSDKLEVLKRIDEVGLRDFMKENPGYSEGTIDLLCDELYRDCSHRNTPENRVILDMLDADSSSFITADRKLFESVIEKIETFYYQFCTVTEGEPVKMNFFYEFLER